jgi:hypothetical protein
MTGALVLGLATPVSAMTATNTTTAAVVPQSPVNYGTVVNFVAQVTSGLGLKRAGNPTVGTPGGTLTFSIGALKLCSATLVPSHSGPVGHLLYFGEAACSSTKAPVGDDAVSASYAGSSTYSPSSSRTAQLVVDSRGTTTTVTVSPPVAAIGTVVTYHATVTGAGSDPTGSVTFTVAEMTADSAGPFTNPDKVCSAAVSHGSASCHANAPRELIGTYAYIVDAPDDVTATYVPTGVAHLGSSGRATLDVVQFNGENDDLDGSTLNAVSCATAKFCVVVDNNGDEVTYANGHWSGPRGVDPNNPLWAVSCPTAQFCAAVGIGNDGTGSVVMYNGSSWSSPQAIAPTPPSPEGVVGLVAISCASSTFCMAADGYDNAYYYNGSSWSGPTSLNLFPSSDEVMSLSCTKPDHCTAVTRDGNVSSRTGTGPGIWLPPGGGGVSLLSSVSCSTPNACTAVGDGTGNGSPGAIASWPGGDVRHTSQRLSAVSCASTTFCVAVGDDWDHGEYSGNPFELTYAGSSWSGSTPIEAADPDLWAISCPSTLFCMAVGDQQVITWSGASAPPSRPPSSGGQPGSTSSCPACGHNLIENPGAEAGPGAGSNNSVPVPDWKATGAFTAVQYAWSGGDYSAKTPGPPSPGKNYFSGGWESATSTGSQTIAVAAGALSGGKVTFTLSAWLGGYSVWSDNATLSAQFQTATGADLATAQIGPVTPTDRNDNTELKHVSTSGTVPAGTRQVLIRLVFHASSSGYNGGAADNLSLVLS